jgi:hypothetical protein
MTTTGLDGREEEAGREQRGASGLERGRRMEEGSWKLAAHEQRSKKNVEIRQSHEADQPATFMPSAGLRGAPPPRYSKVTDAEPQSARTSSSTDLRATMATS